MKTWISKWINEEDGFQVFETSMLMKGGVVLAILVGGFVLAIVAYQYSAAEVQFQGSEVEKDEVLQQFYP